MNWLVGIGTWVKSHILVTIIVSVVVVGGGITGLVVLTGNNKEEIPPKVEDRQDNDTIILKDNLKFEINSELTLLSLVSEDNKVKILSSDEKIDTSILGEKEVTLKYQVEDKEQEKIFKIGIVDTTSPTIEFKKELSTDIGKKIDLLKDVKVTDNSKEDIKASVEGDYDINKAGTYNLKYVAVDSSNNRTEEEFTLKVNKKETTSNNTDNNNNKPSNNTSNNNSSNNSNNNNSNSSNNNNNAVETPKYDINLNDSVMYYESTANRCSTQYIQISSVCWNKTLDQLKTTYPNYDRRLDSLMMDLGISGSEMCHDGYCLDYFPECEESITQGTVTGINGKLKGYKAVGTGRIEFDQLIFKDYKYEKYKSFIDKKSYRLVEYGGCGDNTTPPYKVLDETMCSKYNLSCGRW